MAYTTGKEQGGTPIVEVDTSVGGQRQEVVVRAPAGATGTAISVADGSDVALGAKADAVASTDTGTFSLIALFKRLLSRLHLGAANVAYTQVTAGASAALLAARATRYRTTIRNSDTVNGVYYGSATPITSANGFLIPPESSIEYTCVGALNCLAAAGSPVLHIQDEYG